jgi:hypothetical protein
MCNAGVSRIFCSMGDSARERWDVVWTIVLHSRWKRRLQPSGIFFVLASNSSANCFTRHAMNNRLFGTCSSKSVSLSMC